MNRTRLGRAVMLAASLTLAVTACGESTGGAEPSGANTSGDSSTSDSKDSGPDSGATEAASEDGGSAGDPAGLCGWASPEELESIFGEPVDLVGGDECRVVAEDDVSTAGIYHVSLDQRAGFDELGQRLEENLQVDNSRICEQESTRWQGMRINRTVICPDGGSGSFAPSVILELAPGRVLTSMPHESDSQEQAEGDSRKFVEILKAFAEGGRDLPVINEVMPGQWLEIYNPTSSPVDLSGYTASVYDSFEEGLEPKTITVDSGTVVKPGARVVVDVTGLKGFRSDFAELGLNDAEGGFVDVSDIAADRGEVIRRNGDGGTYCSFGSPAVTKGGANPPTVDNCDD